MYYKSAYSPGYIAEFISGMFPEFSPEEARDLLFDDKLYNYTGSYTTLNRISRTIPTVRYLDSQLQFKVPVTPEMISQVARIFSGQEKYHVEADRDKIPTRMSLEALCGATAPLYVFGSPATLASFLGEFEKMNPYGEHTTEIAWWLTAYISFLMGTGPLVFDNIERYRAAVQAFIYTHNQTKLEDYIMQARRSQQ